MPVAHIDGRSTRVRTVVKRECFVFDDSKSLIAERTTFAQHPIDHYRYDESSLILHRFIVKSHPWLTKTMMSSARGPFLVIISLLLAVANAQWEIGEPLKDYQGLTVKMDYKVQSTRQPEEVVIRYYKDEDCKVPVAWTGSPNNKPFFNADVYNGVSNGDGTKTVRTKTYANSVSWELHLLILSGSDECGY